MVFTKSHTLCLTFSNSAQAHHRSLVSKTEITSLIIVLLTLTESAIKTCCCSHRGTTKDPMMTLYLNIAWHTLNLDWKFAWFNKWCFLMTVPSFSRIMHPATLQKLFRNGLRDMVKSSRCCLGLQIPQISSWTNPIQSMEALSRNLQDLQDLLLMSWCQRPQHRFRCLVEPKLHV